MMEEWRDLTCAGMVYEEQLSVSVPERLRYRKIRWEYRLVPGATVSFHYPDGDWIDGPSPDGCGKDLRLRK